MWIIAFLIAILILVVSAKIKRNQAQRILTNIQQQKPVMANESITVKTEIPKPAIEDLTEMPSSHPEPKKPGKRYLGDEERKTKKIPEIEAKIRAEIDRRQATPDSLPLLIVCGVLELDPHSVTLKHEFIAEVYTRLRLQGQLVGQGPHRIPEWSPVRHMLESVLEASYGMLLYADENLEVVRSYMPMLLSKRRSLISRDEYGDADLQPWADFSSKFAVDKLNGLRPLKFFMEMLASDSERNTVSQQGLADMFGCFTRLAMPLLELGTDKENVALKTGVDYERMLQEQIEQHFPAANVAMTAATGDHGADLIVDIDGLRIAVQAKYYLSAVGNAAVQEAFSGKGFYEADFAMVVCNSSFTRHAKELAEKLDVVLATTDNHIQQIKALIDMKAAQQINLQGIGQ